MHIHTAQQLKMAQLLSYYTANTAEWIIIIFGCTELSCTKGMGRTEWVWRRRDRERESERKTYINLKIKRSSANAKPFCSLFIFIIFDTDLLFAKHLTLLGGCDNFVVVVVFAAVFCVCCCGCALLIQCLHCSLIIALHSNWIEWLFFYDLHSIYHASDNSQSYFTNMMECRHSLGHSCHRFLWQLQQMLSTFILTWVCVCVDLIVWHTNVTNKIVFRFNERSKCWIESISKQQQQQR